MKISNTGLNQIKKYEGLRLTAYLDSVGIPTIGYGATFYEDGTKVKLGEKITIERAESLLRYHVDKIFSKGVEQLLMKPVSQRQFDALVSLAFNIGLNALGGSTLLRRVNVNPNDPDIRKQFLRWNRAGGIVLKGLTNRRTDEANMYFEVVERA